MRENWFLSFRSTKSYTICSTRSTLTGRGGRRYGRRSAGVWTSRVSMLIFNIPIEKVTKDIKWRIVSFRIRLLFSSPIAQGAGGRAPFSRCSGMSVPSRRVSSVAFSTPPLVRVAAPDGRMKSDQREPLMKERVTSGSWPVAVPEKNASARRIVRREGEAALPISQLAPRAGCDWTNVWTHPILDGTDLAKSKFITLRSAI